MVHGIENIYNSEVGNMRNGAGGTGLMGLKVVVEDQKKTGKDRNGK